MRDRSFWDDCADAMELTIEGNRLIVNEIADCLRDQWRAAMRWTAEAARSLRQPRHLPPV
jgi:hypothetical protein